MASSGTHAWRERLAWQTQRAIITWKFRSSCGYYGDFDHPRSFQEKIQYRKLYGNHEFYARIADKYRVRDYVAERVGAQYLIPLYGVHERLTPKDFESLPQRFIIKANHGCKWHQIVKDKSTLDVARTVRYFNRLCRRSFGWRGGERHYRFIPPRILFEELLEGPDGGSPWDYCVYCFNHDGDFQHTMAIVAPDGRAAGFDPDWSVRSSEFSSAELERHIRPHNWDEMLDVARRLSRDFDFVRVDLYSVGSHVYFGELTLTPAQGFGKMKDPNRQRKYDRLWRLDAGNSLLYRGPRS